MAREYPWEGKERSFVLNFLNRLLRLRILVESVTRKFADAINTRHKN